MSIVPPTEAVDVQLGDRIEDMMRDLGQEGFRQAHTPLYDKLETDSKKPLYLGCTTFTRLLGVLALVILKARFRWSDKSFTEFFCYWRILPKDNTLLKNHYETKKILCLVGMEYQKIYACSNIVFCTKISLSKCATALHVRYHATKWSMMNAVMIQSQTTIFQQRCAGIFQ